MQAAQNNQEKSAGGDKSTIAVEQQLVENQLTEERQVREAPDQGQPILLSDLVLS